MIHQKRVVLYINGFRFYPTSVAVTASRNQHIRFQAEFPAIAEWDILPQRSHAAVFFVDPVRNGWRLLCEGEYVGYARSRTSTGQRSRTLMFRGLHGCLESARFMTLQGMQTQTAETAQKAVCDGVVLSGSEKTKADDNLYSIAALLSDSLAARGGIIYQFILEFLSRSLNQLPVESFYSFYRRLLSKFFVFEDNEIAQAINGQLLGQVMQGQIFRNDGTQASAPVQQVIDQFLSMVFYQMNPLMAPPMSSGAPPPVSQALPSDSTAILTELWFSPQLYDVVPPACNVIFNGQLVTESVTRDYAMEPTRVVTQLTAPGGTSIPAMYVATDVSAASSVSEEFLSSQTSPGKAPARVAPLVAPSLDELLQGINPQARYIGAEFMETKEGTRETGNGMQTFMTYATRVAFANARGDARVAQLSCTFLPYLVVGAPCLVGNSSGPYHGYIESVSHFLPCDGVPHTAVVVTHVKEAYQIEGKNRTAPLASWMNKVFRPGQIADTWRRLLGTNAEDDAPKAAMVPASEIAASAVTVYNPEVMKGLRYYHESQVDLDALAARVVSVPYYVEGTGILKRQVSRQDTYEARFLGTQDPAQARLRYNYRTGTYLSQYIGYHSLKSNSLDPDNGAAEPPERLKGAAGTTDLYASPAGLTIAAAGDTENVFGPFKLVNGLDSFREDQTALIYDSIARAITHG